MLRPLAHHAAGDTHLLTTEALAALEFYIDLLKAPKRRAVPLRATGVKEVTAISDASWAEPDESGLRGKVCFVVMTPEPQLRWGGVLTINDGDQLLKTLEPRRSQILAGELLGPLLCLAYAGPTLLDTCTTFYIDNLSALCSIVKGCSRRTDLAGVACGIQVGMDEYRVLGWYDYVESESNFTDGGSRVGVACPLAAAHAVPLLPITDCSLPAAFPHATPGQWREWWRGALCRAVVFRKRVEEARRERWR